MKQTCETKIMEKNKATYKIILVFIIAVQVCVLQFTCFGIRTVSTFRMKFGVMD